jgi:Zn-finger nucleic acid-binding protein
MKCPKCAAPIQDIALEGGAVIHSCPSCAGAFYPRSILAVDVALSLVKETERGCPHCTGRLRTGFVFDGKLELDQCSSCSGLWLDAGEVAKLRTLSGVDGLIKGGAAPAAYAVSERRPVQEFHEEKGGNVPDSYELDNPDALRSPTATLDGVVYKHFQTAVAEVTCALGEFHWKVSAGEQARTRDFIAPPFLLSQEISGKDSVWSQGRWMTGEEVYKAFGLDGVPPLPAKVAPAQPNPWEEKYQAIGGTFKLAMSAALVVGVLAAFSARAKIVGRFPFAYDRAEAEKSKVSQEFELDGRTSNVEILTETNLSNNWAYIGMALINAETGEALDFARDISYYSGSDDEGPWSEGSNIDRALIPAVPAGRYYLRVEPEDGSAQTFTYQITVRRDVSQIAPLVIALLLLIAPMAWVGMRRYFFEVSRWQESDHPWTSEEDDDE